MYLFKQRLSPRDHTGIPGVFLENTAADTPSGVRGTGHWRFLRFSWVVLTSPASLRLSQESPMTYSLVLPSLENCEPLHGVINNVHGTGSVGIVTLVSGGLR